MKNNDEPELAIGKQQCVVCHSKKETCNCGLSTVMELYAKQVSEGEVEVYVIEGEGQDKLVGYNPRAISVMLRYCTTVIQYLGAERVTVLNVEKEDIFDEVATTLRQKAKHVFMCEGKEDEELLEEEDGNDTIV
jgi:hypothetical protein